MTKAQIAQILIFMKEASVQLENAINAATQAADPNTENFLALLLREITLEISRLEQLHQAAP